MGKTPALSPDSGSLKELLRSVSRSFYLSLRFLPKSLRDRFSLGYLLARATDTIADSADCPDARKLETLHVFLRELRKKNGHHLEWTADFAAMTPHEGEAALMRRLPEVFAHFLALPNDDKKAIFRVLDPIVTGQQEDVARGGTSEAPSILADAEELDRYTYQVAGCVGEFWAGSALEKLGSAYFRGGDSAGHVAHGVRLGKGLQLVNILRDVAGDWRKGRCYLPAEDMRARGLDVGRIHENPLLLRELAPQWEHTCAEHLAAGARYVGEVRGWRMRFVAAVPLMLAWKTLEAVKNAEDALWLTGVKVSRGEVKRTVLRAMIPGLTGPFLRRQERDFAV